MSIEPTVSDGHTAGAAPWLTRLVIALPWMWLGLSVVWAVVILITDQLAWPLALWVATTVGPLIALHTRYSIAPPSEGSPR